MNCAIAAVRLPKILLLTLRLFFSARLPRALGCNHRVRQWQGNSHNYWQ